MGAVLAEEAYLNLGSSETTESTDEGRHEEGDRVERLSRGEGISSMSHASKRRGESTHDNNGHVVSSRDVYLPILQSLPDVPKSRNRTN